MLLGVAGPKCSGKDTFASVFNSYSGNQYVIHSFADPLKQVCKQMYLLSDEQLYDREAKERVDARWNLSPRQMFQRFGTDYVRNQVDPNFWLKHFEMWYQSLEPGTPVIVPDVRFQNEVDLIHGLGGTVVSVYRPFTAGQDMHESEVNASQLQNVDYTIDNCGSLLQYYQSIQNFVDRL